MKNIFLLFLLFALSIENCLAQPDYRSGYIIKQNHDTIHGYINYRVNSRNLKECRFKTQIDGEYTNYTPDEIKAFRFDGANFFVALSVKEENQDATYFIEQLIDGVVDVYYYADNQGAHYLIRKNDGELHELKNTRVKVEVDGNTYSKKRKEYIRILKYLYQDSPSTLERVENLSLDQNSLIEMAEFYHNDVCTEYECLVYAKNKRYPKLKLGFFTGYSISTVSFWGNKYIKDLNNNFSKANSLIFGVLLNIQDPYVSERLSLQLEAMFSNADYFSDSSEISINYLKVPLILKYTYPVKKVKSSIQLGLAYNKWIDFEDEGMVPEIQNKNAIQKRRYQYGFLTGFELVFMLSNKTNLFIQGRYEYYGGKHWNQWTLIDALGVRQPFSESVNSKTNFLSITTGLTF